MPRTRHRAVPQRALKSSPKQTPNNFLPTLRSKLAQVEKHLAARAPNKDLGVKIKSIILLRKSASAKMRDKLIDLISKVEKGSANVSVVHVSACLADFSKYAKTHLPVTKKVSNPAAVTSTRPKLTSYHSFNSTGTVDSNAATEGDLEGDRGAPGLAQDEKKQKDNVLTL